MKRFDVREAIAAKTLYDEADSVLGPTKAEAREYLKSIGYSDKVIQMIEGETKNET